MPPFSILLTMLLQAAAAAEDSTIHISLSVTALASLGLIVFREFRPKRNGSSETQRRCGTEELIYWERMEEHVTKPICDAIARDRDRARGASA